MTYPRIEVNLKKIKHNTSVLVNKAKDYDIQIAGVTKLFCGFPEITQAYIDGGVSFLADSRIENLKKLKIFNLPKLLLRLPMISQADEVVEYADISLNSELNTIEEISNAAVKKNIIHKIILMVDLGDLREGYFEEEEVYKAVEKIIELKGVKLVGIGTNLTCYGGVIPRKENLNRLYNISKSIEDKYKVKLEIVSGGNSSSIHLLETGEVPKGINQLRLGESLVLGRETAFGEKIEDTFDDAFELVAEIIELKEKPSVPIGEIGMDAFGNKPSFEDKGVRKRAICAIGRQDIDTGDITPNDNGITILGASSDHLILDVTDSGNSYKTGDKVSFSLSYGGILRAMTSEYVAKIYK